MGWSSGSTLALRIISAVQPRVGDPALRCAVYVDIIEAMEDLDWDTSHEASGRDPAFDAALRVLHPDMDE